MSESIEITIGSTSITTTRDAEICVVYLGTVGDDERRHTAPFGVHNKGLQPIMFEPGGSLVNAGLLHDHLASPHPAFKRVLDSGEIEVFAEPADALKGTGKAVAETVRITRDARVLRAWLVAEEARGVKRKPLLDGLRERLRLYEEHNTPRVVLAESQLMAERTSSPKRRKAS
jgi:hypothetical protein